MKRLLFTLTIACALISTSSFANETVTPQVLRSFQTSFKNATQVDWTVSADLFKASFSFNGQFVTAYFQKEGKMIALTRNISSVNLPITLQADLKSEYEDYWITDLFEVANEEGTTYYVTVENSDSKVVLKSFGSSWTTFQKERKS